MDGWVDGWMSGEEGICGCMSDTKRRVSGFCCGCVVMARWRFGGCGVVW